MKGYTLLASSATLDGILRTISDYYCGAAVTLISHDDRPEMEVSTPRGKLSTIVVHKKGRYRFLAPHVKGGAA